MLILLTTIKYRTLVHLVYETFVLELLLEECSMASILVSPVILSSVHCGYHSRWDFYLAVIDCCVANRQRQAYAYKQGAREQRHPPRPPKSLKPQRSEPGECELKGTGVWRGWGYARADGATYRRSYQPLDDSVPCVWTRKGWRLRYKYTADELGEEVYGVQVKQRHQLSSQ
jgi:hypothetical protein